MTVMLVEDDEFKAADISRVLADNGPDVSVVKASSVNSALKEISSATPELVILDMSLPTFDLRGPGGGGSPQSQGGLEVLRLAKRLRRETAFFVITQYPGIEIDGVEVPLGQAAKRLSEKFGLRVICCISYDFEGDDWRALLIENLNRFFGVECAENR